MAHATPRAPIRALAALFNYELSELTAFQPADAKGVKQFLKSTAAQPRVMKSVIVYGPQACGKTRHAEELRMGFKLDRICDDWDGQHRMNLGVLYLMNYVPARYARGRRVFSFKEALAYVRKAK